MRKYIHEIVFIVLCLGVFTTATAQYDIPEKPKLETSVHDYVGLLSAGNKSALTQKLLNYSDSTSTQIVLIVIPTTKGEDINYLGTNWGHAWGIGQEGKDNGVLILLALEDRKIAISTGYGVEHLLTDALSKRIIENDITPFFKQNNYYGGLNQGVESIFKVLKGEYKSDPKALGNQTFSPQKLIAILMFFFFILLMIIRNKGEDNNGRNGGGGSAATSLLGAILLSNMGRGSYGGGSSGGSGSFGGGGFSGGFGGGGFGGGGASGGW